MKRAFFVVMVIILGVILIPASPMSNENTAAVQRDVSKNIHLKLWKEENFSRYQWQIEPGGTIESIRFKDKNMITGTSDHWIYLKPQSFQILSGKEVLVDASIIKKGNYDLGFAVNNYNPDADLYIQLEMERCATPPIPASLSGIAADRTFSGATYYVRPDGGTDTQCTGMVDAPYPGNGTNQPCAWSHPFWALDGSGNWKIKGGDTIIISSGSYKMGYGAPNTSWCDEEAAFDCKLPPLPSGPNSSSPTRILGKGWNSGCSNSPELWGSQRPWHILDLRGSSNVYIDCLEITDHSDCVEFHANGAVRCERDTYPYGDWASTGIEASDSSNVVLKNLNIHGLASAGIRAGRISNWTIEDVRIAGNGWVGWEGDIDGNDSNSGTLHFKRFTVEWNGCGETYPGGQPHNCWSQSAGGYGDGFGTGTTGGHWIFQDSVFRYNTSDGLDLLYARNSDSQIEIKRTMAYGNAGNAIKVNGPTAIENSLMIGNCGYFSGKSFTYNVDDCRALGNALSFTLRKGAAFSLVNSTIVGQGDCLISGECDDNTCNGSETIVIKNNAFQGFSEYLNPSDRACYLWLDTFNHYNLQMDYNILYNVKVTDQLTLSANDLQQNPLFTNDNLSSFDGHLKTGSPAIDSGLSVGSLNGLIPADDLEGNTRPSGLGVDRGAYEHGSGTITPLITILSPNGGESWQSGSTYNITWTSSGTVGNVKIQFSINSGSSWSTIVSSITNNGSYSWTIPNISSNNCLVKVCEIDGNPADTSDSVFSISTGTGQIPQISLSRTQLYYGAQEEKQTVSQKILISNTGTGTLNWSASIESPWLSCSPNTGNDNSVVTVNINPGGLSPGSYTGNILISDPQASNSPQSVNVVLIIYSSQSNSSPFGSFDTPTNGSIVQSSIPVTGWALDDILVDKVKIYRKSGDSEIYIGDAVFVEGARPDVEQAYPEYPLNYKAGWGYMMLTNFLPNGGNGTYTFSAIAMDIEGNEVSLGNKTITCNNTDAVKPFGAIDTPSQGGASSGDDFVNWAWVLTPQPNRIPVDGSTINVYIDGVNLGHPKYNIYRPDISALFPGYENSDGASGYFTLDTTAYENGVHTLQWTATDSAGNTDGIGSRYFSVENTVNRQQLFFQEWNNNYYEVPTELLKSIYIKRGFSHTSPQKIFPDTKGRVTIEIRELERIVIGFNSDPEEKIEHYTFPGLRELKPQTWRGFLLVGEQVRSLPTGSFLDSEKGIFYWQPGPGYLGEYSFIFIEKGIGGVESKRMISVNILPKF